ncbi:MAG: cell division protein FtsA [Proteobacteria bacterium]|nr:cell division protein FtsA [Pseudomonadota bacterium]MDA1357169.1 cell division protein FtsA [Pseudomonadota bacterium]
MIAALDVGTSKVTCFIAERNGQGELAIVGIGQDTAEGLKAGTVTDMAAAVKSIGTAVHRAEVMADTRVRELFISVSGGAPRSTYADISLDVSGRQIGNTDIQAAFDAARTDGAIEGREIVHAVSTAYDLDGSRGIRNPKGMYGNQLRVQLHMVSVAHGAFRNLLSCLSRCDLDLEAPVISAYASGLACLVEDEKDLGVTIIDMGCGGTGLASFSGGEFNWTATVPLGGAHVTNDIALGLTTPLANAEHMKRLYASAIGGPADNREMIEVPQLGEPELHSARQIPRSLLTGIVRPRLEETFELVRDFLDSSGAASASARRIVLTGGASQLQGVGELASQILEKQVRLARPLPMQGLAEAVAGPNCATCAGLLIYAAERHDDSQIRRQTREHPSPQPAESALGRIGQWLRANF